MSRPVSSLPAALSLEKPTQLRVDPYPAIPHTPSFQTWSQFVNSKLFKLENLLQGDGKDAKDSKDESGPYWSLMFEVSESYCKPVNQKTIKLGGEEWPEIVKETIQGAINTKLTSADDQIVSIYHRFVLLSVHDLSGSDSATCV